MMTQPTSSSGLQLWMVLVCLSVLTPSVTPAALLSPGEHELPGAYIIGGRPAAAGAWPWQGNMMRYRFEHCGCSLISSTWVITAAHCTGDDMSAYSFQFGSVNRKSGGVTIMPKTIIRHPMYGNGTGSYPNDLALVELAKPAEGVNISIIHMAAKGSNHAGNTDCWITGWGIHYPGPIPITPPEVLYEVNIPVLTTDDCRNDWSSQLSDDSVCVGDRSKKGSCSGDSGGPLVCKVDGAFELVGVASWGIVFCWPSVPSIYVGVGYHRDWIASITGIPAEQ